MAIAWSAHPGRGNAHRRFIGLGIIVVYIVFFVDIVDFTTLSASMTAAEVVSILNELFSRFDALTEQYAMEKIKTIGDAYMAVAGVPDPHPDHARRAVDLARAMLAELRDYTAPDGTRIKARIGICSAPVVAGVIGRRKFIYDLWGDTVNTASRMESHGVCNQIQVTESTYRILREDYPFVPRGSVEVKGKGRCRRICWIYRTKRNPGTLSLAHIEYPELTSSGPILPQYRHRQC